MSTSLFEDNIIEHNMGEHSFFEISLHQSETFQELHTSYIGRFFS